MIQTMQQRHRDPDNIFEFELPSGWTAEPEREEGGVEIFHPEGSGVLHLIGFRQAADAFPDPAEELYAFLEDQGIELVEEEVEDLEIGEDLEMAVCEFITEEEEEEEGPVFWRVGVATGPGVLIFASYSCPAGEEGEEEPALDAIFQSLSPLDPQ